jgi:hypothetical protein
VFSHRAGIDRGKIAEYLLRKSSIREIEPKKSMFDDEIRQIAASEYDSRVGGETGDDFIPFDEAWRGVIEFVQSLDIPD